MVIYQYRKNRVEGNQHKYSCDYIFQVQGGVSTMVCVGINGGWHEEIPALSWHGTEDELVAIAVAFLEAQLTKGWLPTHQNNRVEISNEEMEHQVGLVKT
jgi:Sushi repeat (SCR repeat)